MTLEFDPQCGTAQSEDVLRLLIPVRTVQNSGYGPKLTAVHENLNSWIELKKFSGSSGWPTMVLVLPGKFFFFFWSHFVLYGKIHAFIRIMFSKDTLLKMFI